MLYAVKKDLRADLARSILKVRERELQYYTTNILNIGMQAALLSGFAFTTLAQHDSNNVLPWLEQASGSRTFVVIASLVLDPQQLFQVILEMLYLTSTISAMGSTLYVLYICLVTSILGPGLALRGPEGSVDRAVFSLARVNRRVIASFAFALNLFQSSVLVKAFLAFHVIAAVVCSAFVIYYMYAIDNHARLVMDMFNIRSGEVISGRFDDEAQRAATAQAQVNLFPRGAEKMGEAWAGLMSLLRCDMRRAQNDDPDQNKPSKTSREMVMYWQGPDGALPNKPAGGLDAWFEDIFGDERSMQQRMKRNGTEASGTSSSSGTAGSVSSPTTAKAPLPRAGPSSDTVTGRT